MTYQRRRMRSSRKREREEAAQEERRLRIMETVKKGGKYKTPRGGFHSPRRKGELNVQDRKTARDSLRDIARTYNSGEDDDE